MFPLTLRRVVFGCVPFFVYPDTARHFDRSALSAMAAGQMETTPFAGSYCREKGVGFYGDKNWKYGEENTEKSCGK